MIELSLNRAVLNPSVPPAEVVRSAHAAGFTYVEMSAKRLIQTIETDKEARNLLEDRAIIPVHGGWSLRLNWSREKFEQGLLVAEKEMHFAAQWGSRSGALVLPPSLSTVNHGMTEEEMLERIGRTADLASRSGLSLVIEFMGVASEKPLPASYRTLTGALRVVRLVGRANLGILLDSFHWYTSGGTLDEINDMPTDIPLFVHLNDAPAGDRRSLTDAMRELPGSGVIHLSGFLNALLGLGYRGPASIELKHPQLHAMPALAAAETAFRAGDAVRHSLKLHAIAYGGGR